MSGQWLVGQSPMGYLLPPTRLKEGIMRSGMLWVVVTLLAQPVIAGETKYTMEDLQALAKKGSWTELMGHMADIAPAKRDAAWQLLLEQSAVGDLQAISAENQGEAVPSKSNELLKSFPELKTSAEFMKIRAELGMAAFKKCFVDQWAADKCHKDLTDFVALDPKNSDLAMQAGKLARANLNSAFAVGYFARAFEGKKDPKECSDADVALATLAALGLPTDKPEAKQGKKVAEVCYAVLKPQIVDQLASQGNSSYFFANACPLAKAKGDLKGLMAKQCKG
jgi:hypothetical protein